MKTANYIFRNFSHMFDFSLFFKKTPTRYAAKRKLDRKYSLVHDDQEAIRQHFKIVGGDIRCAMEEHRITFSELLDRVKRDRLEPQYVCTNLSGM